MIFFKILIDFTENSVCSCSFDVKVFPDTEYVYKSYKKLRKLIQSFVRNLNFFYLCLLYLFTYLFSQVLQFRVCNYGLLCLQFPPEIYTAVSKYNFYKKLTHFLHTVYNLQPLFSCTSRQTIRLLSLLLPPPPISYITTILFLSIILSSSLLLLWIRLATSVYSTYYI